MRIIQRGEVLLPPSVSARALVTCSGAARATLSVAVLLACSEAAPPAPVMERAPNSPASPGAGGPPAASGAEPVGTNPGAPGASSGGSEAVNIGGLAPLPMAGPDAPGTGAATDPPPVTPVSVVPGTEHYDCSPPSGTLPPLQLVPYVTGLNNPIFITHAPGETDRLFVLEQTGTIQVIRDGALGAAPFLDLTSRVVLLSWEQGLLGLAFHPRFVENGLFYLHYNGNGDGSAVIAEYRVTSDPDVADPSSERILLSVPTVDGYHNGGSINFGPDGLLYIGLGDGGGLGAAAAGQSRANAQDVTSLRGGMSRIDPLASGALPYTLPVGNLVDVNPEAAPELWSKGLRNPYRSNFDPCTGALYIGDVGDRSWEEVDVEPPATGHRNYGWPILEGEECFGAAAGACDRTGLTLPVHAHPNTNAGGPQFQAVIGGSVYRGSAIPALRGTYFFTDLYGNTRTFVYDVATDTISDVVSLESDLNPAENDQGLVSIQPGGDGELYFVSRGSSGGGGAFAPQDPIGTIYRLEAE